MTLKLSNKTTIVDDLGNVVFKVEDPYLFDIEELIEAMNNRLESLEKLGRGSRRKKPLTR